MNAWLLSAGVLMFVVGAVHSALGERLVFRRLRRKGWIPTEGGSRLREPHVRILWATWHVATVQAWAAAVVLLHASREAVPGLAIDALMAAAAVSGLLVITGTRGRHPGGVALLAAALLMWCSPG